MSIPLTYLLDNIHFDHDGFMRDGTLWSPEIAMAIAAREGLTLTDRHWGIVDIVRFEHEHHHEFPPMQKLSNMLGLTEAKIGEMFPSTPSVRLIAMIAGLPNPLDAYVHRSAL
jgi:tRNA 2-thiouridine synthesizing protein E